MQGARAEKLEQADGRNRERSGRLGGRDSSENFPAALPPATARGSLHHPAHATAHPSPAQSFRR